MINTFMFGHDVVAYARESMTAVFIPLGGPPGLKVGGGGS